MQLTYAELCTTCAQAGWFMTEVSVSDNVSFVGMVFSIETFDSQGLVTVDRRFPFYSTTIGEYAAHYRQFKPYATIALSPPSPNSPPPDSSDSGIIGVGVGVGVVVLLACIISGWCVVKRRRRWAAKIVPQNQGSMSRVRFFAQEKQGFNDSTKHGTPQWTLKNVP